MRTLAAIMVSISLVTVVLFAHALATVDDEPQVVRVERVTTR